MENRNYLIEMYNATSTEDAQGEIETYEAWLERQLLYRIDLIRQYKENLSEVKTIIETPTNAPLVDVSKSEGDEREATVCEHKYDDVSIVFATVKVYCHKCNTELE
jgi:hypothetical protein